MSLTIGSKIGPYEIVSPLGEGGMGVVFRARDTRLGRDVAIKVLPDAFANDPDRLTRFEREAQVLASLNHANIAHIYGLEESRQTRCIVMELVEGETIAQKLKRGPLPPDEVLRISKQTLEALEAAHEKGIVHRDMKPGNVMVLPNGNVKVLDFGLAKALEGVPPAAGLSHSPTLSMAATQAGIILGTAAYMSPEQAKGLSADARSDVFSFGCVLFEMLSGRQAFQGETSAEVLASVLVRDPDFKLLPQNLNPKLYDLLRRCLEKNPKGRWHAAADLRIELGSIAADLHGKRELVQPLAAQRRSREKWARTIVAAAVLMVLAVPAFLYLLGPQGGADPSIIRFEIETPLSGMATAVSISPDGKRIVAVANSASGALWVRTLEYLNAQVLQGTEGASSLFWSPDGRYIGFSSGGKLRKVDVLGAPPQTLADWTDPRGGTWNRQGVILLAKDTGPLLRVSANGGPAEPVTELDKSREETVHMRPYFLPDGRHFLFLARSAKPENTAIFAGSLESKERKQLVISDSMPVFALPHFLLFIRQNTLMMQGMDLNRFELAGDPSPVGEQVAANFDTGYGAFSVSENGILAYRAGIPGGVEGGNSLVIVDRMGRQARSLGVPAAYQQPMFSPDQQFLAFSRSDQNHDIWIMDMARGTTSRFTFDPGVDDNPLWSPDARRIAFGSTRDGGVANLYEKASGGAGQEQLLLKTDRPKTPTDWSSDGRYIVYEEQDSKTGTDLWILPTSGDKKPIEYLRTPFNEKQARFSPDGRWIAYASNESGRDEVYVQSFPPTGGKWQVSTQGGFQPAWSRDGKELFYLSTTGPEQFMAVDVRTTPSDTAFRASAPNRLFIFEVRTAGRDTRQGSQRNSYDLTKDGQRFVLNATAGAAAAAAANAGTNERTTITVVLNWAARLKK